jgi:imidazole glycerol-phosphate synthase subunit HisH
MPKEISIIDYGLGNILSLKNSLEHLGYKVNLYSENRKNLSHLYFIPGVGSFKKAMKLIKKKRIDIFIDKLVNKNIPIIGICLGMQILGSWGHEEGKTKGLGLLKVSTKKIPLKNKKFKLPNIGWKNVKFVNKKKTCFEKFNNKKFYFVHSYAMQKIEKKFILANTKYGGLNFISAFMKNKIIGFQFHPEKSGQTGLKLLQTTIKKII